MIAKAFSCDQQINFRNIVIECIKSRDPLLSTVSKEQKNARKKKKN